MTLFDFKGDMPMISLAAPISTQNQGSLRKSIRVW